METKRTIVIVVTFDTKAAAAEYLRDEIASWGLNTILIDPLQNAKSNTLVGDFDTLSDILVTDRVSLFCTVL